MSMYSSSIIPCDDQQSYVVRNDEVTRSHSHAVDSFQRTPADKCFVEQFQNLLRAASEGNLDGCISVVRKGFEDFDAYGEGPYFMQRGSSRVTPLQIAEKNGHLRVAAYLRQAPYLRIDQLKLKHFPSDVQPSNESREFKSFKGLLDNLEKSVKILLSTDLDAAEEASTSTATLELVDYTYERVNRLFINVIEGKKVESIDKIALEKSLSDQSLARERIQLLMQRAAEVEADALMVCFDYQEHADENSYLKTLLSTHTSISKILIATHEKTKEIVSKKIEELDQEEKDLDKLQKSILQTINDGIKEVEKQKSLSSTAKKITSYNVNDEIERALNNISVESDSLKRTMQRIEKLSKTHTITIRSMRNLILSITIPDEALLRCFELLKFEDVDWACLDSANQRSEEVLLKVLEFIKGTPKNNCYLDFAVADTPHCQFVEKLIERGMSVDRNILARAFRREIPPQPALPNETALLLLSHCNETLTDEEMIHAALKNGQSDEVVIALVNKFEAIDFTVMKEAKLNHRSPAVFAAIKTKMDFADKLELLCQIM